MTERDEANKTAKAAESEKTLRNGEHPNGATPADASKSAAGDGAKTGESRATHRKAAESDEPSEPAETGELKKDQPTPVVSIEDKKIDELIARVSLAEAKTEQLLAVNREMSLFFSEQLEAVEALRKSTAAVRGFVESDGTLRKKFAKYLESAKKQVMDSADVQKTVRMRGTLSRMERSGTL